MSCDWPAASTNDHSVFSFFQQERPANGLDEALARYRQICPLVRLAGPTSFAPIIREAMRIVIGSHMQYHILLIIADGQVRPPLPPPPPPPPPPPSPSAHFPALIF